MSTDEVSSDEVRVEIPFPIDMSSFQERLSKLIPVAEENESIFAKKKLQISWMCHGRNRVLNCVMII